MQRKKHDPTAPTSKQMSALLPSLLKKIGEAQKERPDLVVAAWPLVIGEKLAGQAQAERFEKGVLQVKVKNAALYSLLVQHEKMRLLKRLQEKFPNIVIRNITFRMG